MRNIYLKIFNQTKKLLLIIIMLPQPLFADAAAPPIIHGTLGARPFVSDYAHVIREDLSIKIDSRFQQALFNVTYYVHLSKDGLPIPFIFYASEYLDAFSVTIDGKKVAIKKIPDNYKFKENDKFKDFSYLFGNDSNTFKTINLSGEKDFYLTLSDMVYLETDIPKGTHIIEVNYRARPWVDKSGWVKKYSFRYALLPATYRKAYGTLNLKIDASDFQGDISANLSTPQQGDLNSVATWTLKNLSTDLLQITHRPKINKIAALFIKIGPNMLAFITGAILMLLHWRIIYGYRKKHPHKKYSLPVIAGSIVFPLLFGLLWGAYYLLIEMLIGEHAGNQGYGIVMVFFFLFYAYCFFVPLYGVINWLMDRYFKRKFVGARAH